MGQTILVSLCVQRDFYITKHTTLLAELPISYYTLL